MAVGRAVDRSTFGAPFDTVVTLITVVCTLLVGGILAGLVFAMAGDSVSNACFGAGCVALIAGCYGFAPHGYRIEPGALAIERRIGRVVVSLDELQDVTIDGPISRSLGVLGFRNGGLFGVYGRVWRRGRGWTYFWGRRVSNVVTLEFPHHRVLVMPDDPAAFAFAIRHSAWRNDW